MKGPPKIAWACWGPPFKGAPMRGPLKNAAACWGPPFKGGPLSEVRVWRQRLGLSCLWGRSPAADVYTPQGGPLLRGPPTLIITPALCRGAPTQGGPPYLGGPFRTEGPLRTFSTRQMNWEEEETLSPLQKALAPGKP